MSIFDTIIISFLTTLGTASIGFFFYYLRVRMKEKSQSKVELELKKREAFKKLLDEHSEIFLDFFHKKELDEWLKDYSEMRKNILLWGSDEVIYEYAQFVEKRHKQDEIKEHELHFAKAILAFRREIGYKNKRSKITPEQIVHIYRSGKKGNL